MLKMKLVWWKGLMALGLWHVKNRPSFSDHTASLITFFEGKRAHYVACIKFIKCSQVRNVHPEDIDIGLPKKLTLMVIARMLFRRTLQEKTCGRQLFTKMNKRGTRGSLLQTLSS